MQLNPNRLLLSAVCVLSLAGVLSARADEPKADAKTVKLAYVHKVGDTVRYKASQTDTLGGMEVPTETTTSTVVKEVKPSGEFTLEVTVESGTYTINGQEMPIPMSKPYTLAFDKADHLTAYKPDPEDQAGIWTPAISHLIALSHHILFPEKMVKAGDNWTTELDNPAAKDKKLTVKDTFVGMDDADGVSAWKIKQTIAAVTDKDENITFEFTAWLDPKNGQLIKSEETGKGLPTQFGSLDWTGKTVRLKADAPKKEAGK